MTLQRGEMLSKMLVLATNAHAGQYDRGGKPYILHPLKVMYYLKSEDEELQCIALGHDVVEDCEITYQDLERAGQSQRVINGIRCLTKVPGETPEEYLAKVKSNIDAVDVKLADLRHNSDIRRLRGVTIKDLQRIEKYHNMWLDLSNYRKQWSEVKT